MQFTREDHVIKTQAQNIIEAIGNDQFDINHLFKLYHEENAHNHHIKTIAKSIFNSFDRSKSIKVFIDQIKLYQAFKKSTSFFNA